MKTIHRKLRPGGIAVIDFQNKYSAVLNVISVAQVSAGGYHTMIVMTDSTLWATGLNVDGQLGIGTCSNVSTPQLVKF